MTQYAPQAQQVPTVPQRITKHFHVMVRSELDGVFMGRLNFTVSMTGFQNSAEPDTYEVDGQPSTLESVQNLYTWAQRDGEFYEVAEEVAA